MPNQRSLSNGGYPAGTKIYRALITQSGTDAPAATILTNTFGVAPVWSRVTNGVYRATLQGAFPANRTIANVSSLFNSSSTPIFLGLSRTSNDRVELAGFDSSPSDTIDGLIDRPTLVEIIVYPQ